MAVLAPTHLEPHLERATLSPRALEAAGTVVVILIHACPDYCRTERGATGTPGPAVSVARLPKGA